MIEFGKTLKDAREAAGLSIQQIAERTHMMSAMIEDLENERFTRIVAPIYGRGFVKLYCETVGLDPKPLVAEFMDIYTGQREPSIRERVPVTTEPKIEEPVVESEPIAPVIEPESVAEPAPVVEPTPAEATTATAYDLFSQPIEPPKPIESPKPKEPPQFSRYSAPLRDYTPEIHDLNEVKTQFARWAVLAVGAIVIIWGFCAGVRALYKATSKPSPAPTTEAEVTETAPEAINDIFTDKPLPRQPIDVPALYID